MAVNDHKVIGKLKELASHTTTDGLTWSVALKRKLFLTELDTIQCAESSHIALKPTASKIYWENPVR